MSSFPLQPNPPSISHTNASTHTYAQVYSLTCSLSSLSLLLPLLQHRHFIIFAIPPCAPHFSSFSPHPLLSSLLPTSPSLSLPEAYPREPDWSSGCLFGVQLIGHIGYLGAQRRETERGIWGEGKGKGNNGLRCSSRRDNTRKEEVVDVTGRSGVCLHHQAVTF